ncbi:MAG: alginate export family protein [Lentisphaeria bacterium]|nr:alginate export family protein [Lentisphaeria bacterium]
MSFKSKFFATICAASFLTGINAQEKAAEPDPAAADDRLAVEEAPKPMNWADELNEKIWGTFDGQIRLGYEFVDDDKAEKNAYSLGVRLRLGYKTEEFFGNQIYIEGHVFTDFLDDYNDKDGQNPNRAVIADPEGSRIHQLYDDITLIPDTTIRIGRQEIIVNDSRFLGNVDWRQNGQSFDAITIKNTSIENLTFFFGYIDEVETITLDNVETDGLFFGNIHYKINEDHNVAVYSYLNDSENDAKDTATYGVRANSGKKSKFHYDVSYSYQTDYADYDDTSESDMFMAEVGGKVKEVKLLGGYHRISGQDGKDRAFDTLYSTGHKFNGWADQFLSTNGGGLTNGLEDYYIGAVTKVAGVKVAIFGHSFHTTDNNTFDGHYGDELDLLIAKKFTDELTGLIKFAYFKQGDSDAPTEDKTMLAVRLDYKF